MARVPLSSETVRAVARYGPTVNRLARSRYHVSGRQLLARLVAGESHDNPDATSPAGAHGRTQFMPATRQAVLRLTGGKVDPWRSADEAVHAAVLHLTGKLGNAKGLEGYNPGDPSYAGYILGQRTNLGAVSRRLGLGGGGGSLATRGDTLATYGLSPLDATVGPGMSPADVMAALGLDRPQVGGSSPAVPVGLDARARLPMPAGAQVPDSSGGPAPRQALEKLLAQAAQLAPTTGLPEVTQTGTGGAAAGGGGGQVVGGRGRYPLARSGKVIGVPYQGTHTLGNWQSDNAIDIAVPVGTKVLSTGDGRVVKVKGGWHGGSDRFDGYQVTIQTPSGERFYTHLKSVNVRAGQRLRRGQVLGRSGAANGVAHLHFGVQEGDPRRFVS